MTGLDDDTFAQKLMVQTCGLTAFGTSITVLAIDASIKLIYDAFSHRRIEKKSDRSD